MSAPVDVRSVGDLALNETPIQEIERTPITVGSSCCDFGELFSVRRTGDDLAVQWQGDLRNVHYIGCRLRRGELRVDGDTGDCLGSQMSGGRLTVNGDTGLYAGQGMLGGTLIVQGNAGDCAGGASASVRYGLAGGMLLVHGNVGSNAGYRMRRGILVVAKNAGDFAARSMLAGTILVGVRCGQFPGLGMKRGTLLLSEDSRDLLPPTFAYACRGKPLALDLVMASLRHHDFSFPPLPTEMELYNGDQLEGRAR